MDEISPPNKFRLKGTGGDISEWAVRMMDDQESGRRPIKPQGEFSYSRLVIGKSFPTRKPGTQGIIINFGYPWEVFSMSDFDRWQI